MIQPFEARGGEVVSESGTEGGVGIVKNGTLDGRAGV